MARIIEVEALNRAFTMKVNVADQLTIDRLMGLKNSAVISGITKKVVRGKVVLTVSLNGAYASVAYVNLQNYMRGYELRLFVAASKNQPRREVDSAAWAQTVNGS
jgi:hypothetical protein